jgi:hypothetical protein
VRTGDPCPASGWWRCDDSHALDGTRWFAQGSLLPAATFRVSPTVFGKRSAPDLIQRRSMWHLVRHAPEAQAARTPGEMRDAAQAGRPPQSPDTAPGVTASEA